MPVTASSSTAMMASPSRMPPAAAGPPELPGFSAASVWITSSTSRPAAERSERPRALTTPAVTELWNPSGLPMAMASCPTRTVLESPRRAYARPAPLTRSTATSVSGSMPTTSACAVAPSGMSTRTVSATSTT